MTVHRGRRWALVERRGATERAAALLDVRDEFIAELRDVARDDDRVGVTERAEALAVDPVADVQQQVEVLLRGAPVLELAEDRRQPAGAFAARCALAARLVLVELREPDAELHDAAAIVQHD